MFAKNGAIHSKITTSASGLTVGSIGNLNTFINAGTSGSNVLDLQSGGTTRVRVQNSGLEVNPSGLNSGDFIAQSDNNTHMLFVDASADAVGIGTSSLTEKLEVSGSINTTNQSTNFTAGSQRGFMDIVDSSKHVRIGSLQGAATPSGTEGTVELLVNGATKATIDTSGNLQIADGDLVISTNGHGIDFSAATLGSSVSNMSSILDDYEEGSFTPAFSHGGSGYSNRIGSYVKVGGTVNFNIYIQMSSWFSSSDNLQITGLPFASGVAISGLGNSYGGAWVSYVVGAEGSTPIAFAHIGQQQTQMNLYSHSGGTQTNVTASGHSNSFGIIINGIYHVK